MRLVDIDFAQIEKRVIEILATKNTRAEVAVDLGMSERSFRAMLSANSIRWVDFKKNAGIVDGQPMEDELPVAKGTVKAPDKTRGKFTGKRYVFTSAQNNTHIHEDFFAALQVFCRHNDAELVVSRFAYNKKGYQKTKDAEGLWYDKRLEEYFNDTSMHITNDLIWCGELDILPTAVRPVNGFMSYTQDASGVIPHAKVQMLSCPVLKPTKPKFLYTTGAITQRNYIDRRVGQVASFHHVFGALYVEADEQGDWFARQLIASEDGAFHDLHERFSHEGVTEANVAAINWGDIHAEKLDEEVAAGSWVDNHCMLDTLQPEHQFVHDVSDFTARNHHNIKDPYFLAEMQSAGTDKVQDGLAKVANVLVGMDRDNCVTVVVNSNHDAALKRWLREADITQDPVNARLWHELNAKIYEAIEDGNFDYDPFIDYMESQSLPAWFLSIDDSYKVHGIECGMHGHIGLNGSRGSPMQFRNITKCNTGHTHSAGIIDGVFTAGVSGKMEQGYNHGATTWSQSHIVTYATGKRAIVTMRGKKWRA